MAAVASSAVRRLAMAEQQTIATISRATVGVKTLIMVCGC